jgi:hypothetical protein
MRDHENDLIILLDHAAYFKLTVEGYNRIINMKAYVQDSPLFAK